MYPLLSTLRTMKRLFAILAAFLLPPFLMSCLWDSDTMYEEAQGNGDTLKVIVGWFDRNPDLYYSMRLDRVSKELEKDPAKLENYDDAAVSCDRLHRSLEAIEWMKKKRAQLDKTPDKEHEYRYHANIGTFYAHHWISLPVDHRKEQIATLKLGLDHIVEAIKINPDAHFGREIYQAAIIHWIYEGYTEDGQESLPSEGMHAIVMQNQMEKLKLLYPNLPILSSGYSRDIITKGLAGLIRLGAAWQSPDVFEMLGNALGEQFHETLAVSAYLRAKELRKTTPQSINPKYTPPAFDFLDEPDKLRSGLRNTIPFFHKARSLADKRHEDRTAYMMARLQKGMHPDTHPDFWNDWVEPDFPTPPGRFWIIKYFDDPNARPMVIAIGLIILPMIYKIYHHCYKARKKNAKTA